MRELIAKLESYFMRQIHHPSMSTDFIAIGVGQGDAFFIKRRDGFAALIDGGRSRIGFPKQFQRATKRKGVDVVICTHNDDDHAKGIIGFLQEGLHCKEVWLPASWTDRLNDLFHPERFIPELVDNVTKLGEAEVSNIRERDTLFEGLADRRETEEIKEAGETVDAEALAERALDENDGENFELSFNPLFYWYPCWWFSLTPKLWTNPLYYRLFVEAIAAGNRIRQITQLAFHRGCRIRWFEYSQSKASGGIPGKLVPVNAREVFRVKVNKLSALMYLALTTTNKQSLVFYSPGEDADPTVLFTADSDLSFQNTVPWSAGMMITAPHHGSEDNIAAYKRFQKEMRNPTSTAWVRSDGRFKSRPGKSFLDLRGANVPVFCTLCRDASRLMQDLVFTGSRQGWNPGKTLPCSCS